MGSSRKPSASSSSMIACLRAAALPALQEIVETDKTLLQCPFSEVAQGFGDKLPVFVQVFHPFGDNGCAHAVHIDLGPPRPIGCRRYPRWVINDRFVFTRFRRYEVLILETEYHRAE